MTSFKRTPDPAIADMATRLQRKMADPSQHVWVSANAGTGKTEVLTRRILTLLITDETLSPHEIVGLTFTNAAAFEMAERLRARITAWTTMTDTDLTAALHTILGRSPTSAETLRARRIPDIIATTPPQLTTLHGFAVSILSRFPYEADLPTPITLLDADAQRQLLTEAIRTAMVTADDTTAEHLDTLLDLWGDNALDDMTEKFIGEWASFQTMLTQTGLTQALANLHALLDLNNRHPYPDIVTARPVLMNFYAALCESKNSTDTKKAEQVNTQLNHPSDDAWCQVMLTQKHTPIANIISVAVGKDSRVDGEAVLDLQRDVHNAYWSTQRQHIYDVSVALMLWGAWVNETYVSLKRTRHVVDFDDLMTHLERFLANADHAWLHYRLDNRIRHILLDEGQDNSPRQHAIFTRLASDILSGTRDEPRTVFAVGDMKQSIYRFQGARPSLFLATHDAIQNLPDDKRLIETMRTSFRSSPAILKIVDDVFSLPHYTACVTGDDATPWPTHQSAFPHDYGRVEVWPLIPPNPRQKSAPSDTWEPIGPTIPTDDNLFQLVDDIANDIRKKMASLVLSSTNAFPTYGDILILTQRNSTATQLAVALERLGIPATCPPNTKENPSLVEDIRAWILAALNPHDRHALAVLLKSPLVGWNDAQLMALHTAATHMQATWHTALPSVDTDTAAWLAESHHRLTTLLPHEAFAWLVHTHNIVGRYDNGDALRRTSARIIIDTLHHNALSHKNATAWLAALEKIVLSPPTPHTGNRVQVMTVHKAKGLEAPVVYLAETNRPYGDTSKDKLLWIDNDSGTPSALAFWPNKDNTPLQLHLPINAELNRRRADKMRELYVAMTRAKDVLIVCGGVGKQGKPDDDGIPTTWHELLRTTAEREKWPTDENGRWIYVSGQTPRATTLTPPPQQPTTPPHWLAEKYPVMFQNPSIETEATRYGHIIHVLLEMMPAVPESQRESVARAVIYRQAPEWNETVITQALTEAMAVMKAFPHFFTPTVQSEVSIILEDGALGRIDRLVNYNNALWIVDFKTDATPSPHVPTQYHKQLSAYRRAITHERPDVLIHAALVWTRTATLVEI